MSGELPHRRKALPLSQSILWAPGDAPAADQGAYVTFMHQRALNALHEHLRSSPDKGVLGFMLGHLYEDPPSGQKFAVIELVMRLTVAIYGDKTTVVVSRVWDKMQEELTRSGSQLLGWYHSHPPGGVELAQGDLETHATYFGQVYQSALVIGMKGDGALGALYRPRGDGSDAGVPLPFYELLDPRSVTPDGKKRSSVRWGNYRPQRPPVGVSMTPDPDAVPKALSFKPTAPPPPPPPPKPPPPSPPPPPSSTATIPRPNPNRPISADMVQPGDITAQLRAAAPSPPPPPPAPQAPEPAHGSAPAPPRRRTSRPQPRFLLSEQPRKSSHVGLVLSLLLLLAGGGGAAWYFLMGPGSTARSAAPSAPENATRTPAAPDTTPAAPPASVDTSGTGAAPLPPPTFQTTPAPPPAPAPSTAALAVFDRVSDSVQVAINGYHERARLYQGGLVDCTILARGLVAFETVWTRYEAVKRDMATQLDGARAQRDLALFANVDSVSAHYDRSGCRRP
jgi:proteasome lid subunit RPN8/RPN11